MTINTAEIRMLEYIVATETTARELNDNSLCVPRKTLISLLFIMIVVESDSLSFILMPVQWYISLNEAITASHSNLAVIFEAYNTNGQLRRPVFLKDFALLFDSGAKK